MHCENAWLIWFYVELCLLHRTQNDSCDSCMTAAGQDTTGILKDEGCNGGRNLGTSEPRGASGPWIFRLQRQLHCKARDLESLLKLVPGAEAAAVEDTSCLVLGRTTTNKRQAETRKEEA